MFPADSCSKAIRFFRTWIPSAAPLGATALLCVALTSCGGDYCIIGIFNPVGIVAGTTNPCVNNKAMGNVFVRITTAAASTDGPNAPNLLHLFATVQGIEAHPNAMAADDSPDWEELAPDLVREPMQIDLLAHAADSCATNRVPGTPVSAGVYRQLRLRLVSNHSAAGGAVPPENACRELGFHCAISPDGRVHPLAFDRGSTILRLEPDRISGGFIRVLPEADTHLTIEFNQFASFAAPSGDTVQLSPVFNVNTVPSCRTTASSEP